MKTVNKRHIILYFALTILLWAMPFTSIAQDAMLAEDFSTSAGLSQLPDDLRGRWISLKSEVDTVEYAAYFQEGELVIKQLGELILAVGGSAPEPGQASYGVYADLQNKLLSVLDRIELALVLGMPDSDLHRMLDRYRVEKNDLSSTTRSERQKLIDAGTKILKSHENDPYFLKYPHRRAVLADLYFRLTELLYEESYDSFLEETDNYISMLDSLTQADPEAARALRPPQPDYSRVMAMYQRIVDEFPTSEFADDALYNLGILTGTGESQAERAAANTLFEALVKIYPESNYKLNCLRRIGEYYFMPPVNDLDKAVATYAQITTEYAASEYYSEALYKLGWCYYRMSEIPTAVEYFAKSLDVGYKTGTGTGQSGLNIAKESINYIGVCFAVDSREWDGAGIDNMVVWLQSNPTRMEKYGKEVIRQLGVIYRTQIGRYSDAVVVYDKYVELFPLDPSTPSVMNEIVEIYQSGEVYNPQAAHVEKLRYFENYNPDSEWWKVNSDQKAHDSVIPKLEQYLDMGIDEKLVLATDSKDQSIYSEYVRLSRQYLRFWPNGAHVYKVHYNLASVLEKIPGQEPAAIREYWQVATTYADTSRKGTAEQRVVAIAQELVKKERAGEISVSANGEVAPPVMSNMNEAPVDSSAADTAQTVAAEGQTPLLNSERLLLSSFDLFTADFPGSQLTPTMLYQGGDILYQHQWFPESRKYLERLIAEYPDHKYVEDAYKLILEGYFKVNDYASVEKVALRIADSPNISDDLKTAAKRRKAESVFLTASDLKEGNDHKAAADEFKRVALESPDYQYADRSVFQSGLEYMQANSYPEANEMFKLLADRYPQSEFADKALYNLGFNLQTQIKDLRGSAEAYERLVKGYPKSDLNQGALANASANYNQVGDDRSAIRVNQLYVQMFPQAEDASVYLFENASHYMKLEEVDRANEIYKQFAQRYPDDPRTVQAFFERGKYALDKGDRNSAAREFTATLDAHQKLVTRGLSGSPRFASQSLSYLLEWEQEEYYKLRITGNEAAVKAAKERKKQWRNALVEKYQQLIRYGQKEAYRSFFSIGKLDEDFALATYQQEVPQSKELQGRIDALAKVVDEAILLNYVAAQSYKSGFENLRAISAPLKAERARRQSDYEAYSGMVAQLQKDTSAVGIADSLSKLSSLQRVLTEIDSAVIEAGSWADSCRKQIPAVAILNGKYLTKLWYANFDLRSNDKDEEIRMLFREEVIKNIIATMAPEICGLYLQAWNEAKAVGLGSQWHQEVEEGYHHTVDTLIAQYVEQTNLAQSRIDRLISDFASILPKGESAKTKQGYYSDELGGIILDQIDYLNTFSLDMLNGYRLVLDSAVAYNIPYGFGEDANDQVMDLIVRQSDNFSKHAEEAGERLKEYTAKYDETGEIQYDDAQVAFEDIGTNFNDYSLALLEAGLGLRQKYNLSGMAGIALVTKLVTLNPEQYGSQVGLSSERYAITTDTDWKVYPERIDGFEYEDFDDSDWENVTLGGFPPGVEFGILDSMDAKAVWYYRDKPAPTLVPTTDQESTSEGMMPSEPTEAGDMMGSEEEMGDSSDTEVDLTDEMADSTAMSDSTVTEAGEGGMEQNMTEAAPDTGIMAEEMIAPVRMDTVWTAADSSWQLWMAADSNGVRSYWFRKSFTIDQQPSGGKIWLTADDDFSLYINGTYVADDNKDDNTDWQQVDEHGVLDYLKIGKNLIAIEASDVNSTRQGVMAGLIYEFVPDMNKQLASLSERETERDRTLKEQAAARLKAEEAQAIENLSMTATAEAPAPVAATPDETVQEGAKTTGPTQLQLRDMRIIEKNKLR